MTLRINTNIAALNAHKNMIKNDNSLSASLEKLSSGLRINKAADDASGMAIADSLKSQGMGLGQAVRNANDGISMVQTADGALQESINIVNSIKTKSIQAAQDGQTTDSRKAIQADITKLMQELDNIAKTTSFNGQKLLSGNFTDKKFQVGAYSGETLNISIGSAESTKIGHISTSNLTFADKGTAALSVYSNQQNQTYNLNTVDVAYDNTREHSMGAVADAINKLSDVLGITADASVSSTTTNSVAAGTTDATFAINGVLLGALTVQNNDADGALVAAINNKTSEHGVIASVDQAGKLTLTSTDNRAIDVTQGTNTTAVLGNTTSMKTLGTVALTQQGTSDIVINNRAGGTAVALVDNLLETSGVITTTASSTMASGSTITSGSTIGGGSILATGTDLHAISGPVYTTGSSVVGSGSTLSSGTIIASGTTLTASAKTSGIVAGTGTLGNGSKIISGSIIGAGTTIHTSGNVVVGSGTSSTTGSSTLAKDSVLSSGSTLAVGTTFLQTDIALSGLTSTAHVISSGLYYRVTGAEATSGAQTLTNGSATLASGSKLLSGSKVATDSSIGAKIKTSGLLTTNADMTLKTGTSIVSGSTLATNTKITGATIDLGSGMTLGGDMTLTAGSTITDKSTLATGSNLSNAWYNHGDISVTGGSMTLAASSSLATGAVFAEGSSLGGSVTLKNTETVDASTDMLMAAGSTLASGSKITTGTVLTNDVVATDGKTYTAGTSLTSDITTSGATSITNAMTLNGGSTLVSGTVLAANAADTDSSAVGSTTAAVSYRLSDVDVTSQDGAQIAISVADSALKSLDKVRSSLGSVQNQLTSTISNISTTQVNIFSAESSIRDVDFADESSNFSKMQILVQASSFAMAQANASGKSVLSLLQG